MGHWVKINAKKVDSCGEIWDEWFEAYDDWFCRGFIQHYATMQIWAAIKLPQTLIWNIFNGQVLLCQYNIHQLTPPTCDNYIALKQDTWTVFAWAVTEKTGSCCTILSSLWDNENSAKCMYYVDPTRLLFSLKLYPIDIQWTSML